MVRIEIIGPGLVVNGPAMVVLKTLRDAGFDVRCEDWPGLLQWGKTPEEREELLRQKCEQGLLPECEVIVHPEPWGG